MGARVSSSHFGRAGELLVLRMKLFLWLSLLGLVALSYSQVSDCSMNCSKSCKCPCAKANTKALQKFTKMKGKGKNKKPVANAPCLYDPEAGNTCGRCIKGGKQCGFPMQKWCQNPKSRNGCPGVPNNKYTLSTRGAPCYWDTSDRTCAICKTSKMRQCGSSSIATKCGYFCAPANDKRCDGNLFNCAQINPMCAAGADCIVNSKKKTGDCKCGAGMTGLGFNSCFANGSLVTNPEETVKISMDTTSQYFIYTQDEL